MKLEYLHQRIKASEKLRFVILGIFLSLNREIDFSFFLQLWFSELGSVLSTFGGGLNLIRELKSDLFEL